MHSQVTLSGFSGEGSGRRERSHEVGRGVWIKKEIEERKQGLDLLKTHYMHNEMLKKTKIDHT